MKTVKDILDLSGKDHLSKYPQHKDNHKGYPPEKDMPTVLIFKRKAIRSFPDKQMIGLYYSQALDRYLSIPFGPNSKNVGLHLSESKSKSKSKPKSNVSDLGRVKSNVDILKRAGLDDIAAQYGEHQSSLGPEGETSEKILRRIARKIKPETFDKLSKKSKEALLPHMKDTIRPWESLHALGRWHGTKLRAKFYGKEKPVEKPNKDDVISKLSDWKPTEKPREPMLPKPGTKPPPALAESFRLRLREIREERLDERRGVGDAIRGTLDAITGAAGNIRNRLRRTPRRRQEPELGQTEAGRLARRRTSFQQRRQNRRERQRRDKEEMDRYANAPGKKDRGGLLSTLGGLAGAAFANSAKELDPASHTFGMQAKVGTPGRTTIAPQRQKWEWDLLNKNIQEESTISQIRNIVENNLKSEDVVINESSVTVSNRVAKKILYVYESLNKTNRKKLEKMLNEDVASFRKAINFAIRQ